MLGENSPIGLFNSHCMSFSPGRSVGMSVPMPIIIDRFFRMFALLGWKGPGGRKLIRCYCVSGSHVGGVKSKMGLNYGKYAARTGSVGTFRFYSPPPLVAVILSNIYCCCRRGHEALALSKRRLVSWLSYLARSCLVASYFSK